MDDLSSAMGGSQPMTPAAEMWHNEQKRQQYDIIRVVNPTSIKVKGIVYELPHNDFFIMYDVNQYQKIAYGETKDIARPRARLYAKHKTDEIINFINKKMHDEHIASRRKKGFPDYTDKAIENKETYESAAYPRTNDKEITDEITDQIVLGMTVKASNDAPPSLDPRSGEVDLTPTYVKSFDAAVNKMVAMPNSPQTTEALESTPATVYSPQSAVLRPTAPQTGFASLTEKLEASDVTQE